MKFKQLEKTYKETMENAIAWAKEEDCQPIHQDDLLIIGECLNMNLHKSFHNFVSSSSIDSVKAHSSHKTILKQLGKIKEGLLNYSLVG